MSSNAVFQRFLSPEAPFSYNDLQQLGIFHRHPFPELLWMVLCGSRPQFYSQGRRPQIPVSLQLSSSVETAHLAPHPQSSHGRGYCLGFLSVLTLLLGGPWLTGLTCGTSTRLSRGYQAGLRWPASRGPGGFLLDILKVDGFSSVPT